MQEMNKALTTYLNDHHAGAAAALSSLEALQRYPNNQEIRSLAAELLPAIEEDRQELNDLIEKLGAKPESAKSTGAWIAEKISRLKFRLHGVTNLGIFESLDTLSLGISGKKAFWTTLQDVAPRNPALLGVDYENLKVRAQEQFEKVEAKRQEVAREIFR